ncbi:hypothetical protein CHUAL_001783 [Chamberlinius hualienensis]
MKIFIVLYTLFPYLLLVGGLNESFANWTSNVEGPGLINYLLGQILSLPVYLFSEAFKDFYWCYHPYPCLQIGGPFISVNHPVNISPYPPEVMKVKLNLYTRMNPNNPFVFDNPNDISKISQSNFNSNAPTKFLVGGFFDGNGTTIVNQLVSPLLLNSDCNVFNVNWFLASSTTYSQATANIRLVGAILGRFIELLHNETGLSFSQCHLIGHSLGAHAAGYAGQYLTGKIGRISGLDPAGPYFYDTDPVVRLDTTDAQFVDIMHTNKGSLLTGHFGIDQVIGHIDVFPNGGEHQPNCSTDFSVNFGELANDVRILNSGCSHVLAPSLYAATITSNNNNCIFTSYPCPSYNDYQNSMCFNNNPTVEMGYNSYKYAEINLIPAPYSFYVDTNGAPPYCKNNSLPNSNVNSPPLLLLSA